MTSRNHLAAGCLVIASLMLTGVSGCSNENTANPTATPSTEKLPKAGRATDDSGGLAESTPARLKYDHHVHLFSRRFIEDCQTTGVLFGAGPVDYIAHSDPVSIQEKLGIDRGIAISCAYFYTTEDFAGLESVRNDEAALVAAENDFIAQSVRQHPHHWVGFFSINPLSNYAAAEMDRCLQQPELVGLKLHLPVCGIDLTNREHFQATANAFDWCEKNSIPILIHPFHGGEPLEAVDRFWHLIELHPTLQVIIAHVGSSGGFNAKSVAVLEGFEALRTAKPKFKNAAIYFDLSGTILASPSGSYAATSDEYCRQFSDSIRRIGLDCFLPATDYPVSGAESFVSGLRDKLKLSDEEISVLLNNVAPVLASQSPQHPE